MWAARRSRPRRWAQAGYIRTVLQIMRKPENSDFRWNCETWFCVEEFLKDAAPDERAFDPYPLITG